MWLQMLKYRERVAEYRFFELGSFQPSNRSESK